MKKLIYVMLCYVVGFELHAQVENAIDTTSREVQIEVIEMVDEAQVELDNIRTFENDGKTGLKDYVKNEVLLEAKYWGIFKYEDDFFKINDEGKYGLYSYMDKKIVIPIEYDEINIRYIYRDSIKERIIVIIKDQKSGMLDKNFGTILKTEYDYFDISYEYCIAAKDSLEGAYLFDCNCFKVPIKYKSVANLYGTEGFTAQSTASADYYNSNGELVFNNQKAISQYRSIYDENNRGNLLIKNQDDKVGLYNTRIQKLVLPQVYSAIYETYLDNFLVKKKLKFGIVDTKNDEKVAFKYDSLAFLKPHYIINEDLRVNKSKVDSFVKSKTLILALKKGKFGLINREGKKIVDFEYDEIQNLNYFYKLKKNNKYQIANSIGKLITEQKFDDVGLFMPKDTNWIAAVFNDGKMGYITDKGILAEPVNRKSEANGYKDVNELYQQFVNALNASEDTVLYEFCKKLNPDNYSKEFMERIYFSYRGFPDKYDKNGFTIKNTVDKSYKTLLYFKNYLIDRKHIGKLKFIGLKRTIIGYEDFRNFETYATEAPGLLKADNRIYTYKLGELINIDGYWKSFTESRKL